MYTAITCHYTATMATTNTGCTQHAMTTSGRPYTEHCTQLQSAQYTHTHIALSYDDHTTWQMLTSAPFLRSSWTTVTWPLCEATYSAVLPSCMYVEISEALFRSSFDKNEKQCMNTIYHVEKEWKVRLWWQGRGGWWDKKEVGLDQSCFLLAKYTILHFSLLFFLLFFPLLL